MTHFGELIERLARHSVDCVIIGGVALVSRGGSRATNDLDIVYERSAPNIARLVEALSPTHPHLRGVSADLPFFFDARTVKSGLNFTLVTDLGEIDLFGEIPGVGGYDSALSVSSKLTLFGHEVSVLNLDGLERSKRAAGRAKDVLDLEMIRALKTRA